MKTPRVVDDNSSIISCVLNGAKVMSWVYWDEPSRRVKLMQAHDFSEGWYRAMRHGALQGFLYALWEYLDDRQDAETFPDGVTVPNEEMKLLIELEKYMDPAP